MRGITQALLGLDILNTQSYQAVDKLNCTINPPQSPLPTAAVILEVACLLWHNTQAAYSSTSKKGLHFKTAASYEMAP